MNNTELVDIDEIKVGSRVVAPKAERVKALAGSISELGLLQPIVITNDRHLIAGLHRLRACESLGWSKIAAVVTDHEDKMAELAEVDENLVRNNLTALEEGELLVRRKTIYEELHPSTKRGVAGAKAKHAKAAGESASAIPSFAADTAAKTGQSERNVQNKIAAVSKLPEDIREAIRGTELANNVAEMKRLAKYNKQPAIQKKIAEAIKNEEAKTVSRAVRMSFTSQPTTKEEMLDELQKACSRVEWPLHELMSTARVYGGEMIQGFRPTIERVRELCEMLLEKIDDVAPIAA